MKQYDPDSLLISFHVPKCAGVSVADVLTGWFGSSLHLHYPAEESPAPLPADTSRHKCVHGHFFSPDIAAAACDYYPAASQMITFLRHPLNMAISSYRFARARSVPVPCTLERYIEAVCDAGILMEYKHLPYDPKDEGSIATMQRDFVYVGVVEDFALSVRGLASALGFAVRDVPHLNALGSSFPPLSANVRRRFGRVFEREIEFFLSWAPFGKSPGN